VSKTISYLTCLRPAIKRLRSLRVFGSIVLLPYAATDAWATMFARDEGSVVHCQATAFRRTDRLLRRAGL
jgi:hypothetical protein